MRQQSRAPDLERVFERLYAATYADLLRFAQRRVDRSHAEDVVAEAFLVAWRRLDELPAEPSGARAWLFGVARKVLLNTERGVRRRQALGVRLADTAGPASDPDNADLTASRLDLARAWERISETHQEVLSLAVFEDLTSSQAAAVLDISPVAFRLRLSRARRALRAHLQHLPTAIPAPPLPTPPAETPGVSERTICDAQ